MSIRPAGASALYFKLSQNYVLTPRMSLAFCRLPSLPGKAVKGKRVINLQILLSCRQLRQQELPPSHPIIPHGLHC